MTFLLAPENMVFGVALVLMRGIGLLEGVMALFGGGLSHLLDALLPDSPSPGGDFGLDLSSSDGALSHLLDWICLGRVPLLVLLIACLGWLAMASRRQPNRSPMAG